MLFRYATSTIVWLIVGTIVSTGVAFGCLRFSPLGSWEQQYSSSLQGVPRPVATGTPYVDTNTAICRAIGAEYRLDTRTHGSVGACVEHGEGPFVSWRAGWPLLAWRSHERPCAPSPQTCWAFASSNLRVVMEKAGQGYGPPSRSTALPTTVEGRAFAANAGTFAALSWILGQGSLFIRRRYRIARGRCWNCGYETSGLNRCPECGVERAATV